MAVGELHMDRIILGAAIGVGAIAAAPFTGGGSVLGAATLAVSLSGIETGLAAATVWRMKRKLAHTAMVTGKQRKNTEQNSKRQKKSSGR